MSKGLVLKSKRRSEDGRRTAGILEGITVSVTNMKPDRGKIKKIKCVITRVFECHRSVVRDVTALQCVCFMHVL